MAKKDVNKGLSRQQILEKARRLAPTCGRWSMARMLAKSGIPVEDAIRVLASKPSTDLDFTKR